MQRRIEKKARIGSTTAVGGESGLREGAAIDVRLLMSMDRGNDPSLVVEANEAGSMHSCSDLNVRSEGSNSY